MFADVPNARSLHKTPTPRVGGIGIVVGLLCGWLIWPSTVNWWLILPLLGLFTVSLLDDVRQLSVRVRLSVHWVAAVMLVIGSNVLDQQGILAALAVMLGTVWMTNLYNFMDGSDGLAGGMAVIGFGCYGVGAWQAGDSDIAVMSAAIVGAALGFLHFNFPKAKVFLGDSGSIPLGFLAMAIGLWGWLRDDWAVWFPLMVFSPFIVDATVTLVKRTLRGASITEAHRDHYYQRLVRMGMLHRKVAYLEFSLMLAAGASSLTVSGQSAPALLLMTWLAIYTFLMLWIDVVWSRKAH
ncbi:MAG: glycosyltransferase family 4 protein [Gammaproteobacteria bacterium]|nr:glycosyltransferase family 4 protein [Sideroxydans sp.]MBU3903140.1 glycosyltransferase family 4 protein [Gammaproteobacteria bacterium]MBU4046215.1 glycosyltransferase family 4 protein [Gammaproteobacteria bacterium]